jgi:preprotein translocase subunit SecD
MKYRLTKMNIYYIILKGQKMKYFFGITIFLLFFSNCSKNNNSNNDFVRYLDENKKNMAIYIINDEETKKFNKIYPKYDEDIFDINGLLKSDYTIPENNRLLGYYKINNKFEEEFFGYYILRDEALLIGNNISKMAMKNMETNILLTFYLDDIGNKMFNEFTTNNINNSIAIVFDNKIIVIAMILKPLNNSINIGIDY